MSNNDRYNERRGRVVIADGADHRPASSYWGLIVGAFAVVAIVLLSIGYFGRNANLANNPASVIQGQTATVPNAPVNSETTGQGKGNWDTRLNTPPAEQPKN